MKNDQNKELVEDFFSAVKEKATVFFRSIELSRKKNEEFDQLAGQMLLWAKRLLGSEYITVLLDGYKLFTSHVNNFQRAYEHSGIYENDSYEKAYESVYSNLEFMKHYHWGVYATTFCWSHHVKVYSAFNRFISLVSSDSSRMLDLGSGSGIWSMLAASMKPELSIQAVDISPVSVEFSRNFVLANGFADQIAIREEDALAVEFDEAFDCAMSCFLLEHLADPSLLFANLAKNLKPRGYAFLTAGLTAAELDHIYEFRRESEVLLLAEEAGFRVLDLISAGPTNYSEDHTYLPRTQALILQKRKNSIW